jgi:hypothetical protein
LRRGWWCGGGVGAGAHLLTPWRQCRGLWWVLRRGAARGLAVLLAPAF